jgi:hypothetical protein
MSAKARYASLTAVQKRYLRFIDRYSRVHGVAPSFSDIQHALCVTSPSAHRMVLTLEKRGALARVPGRTRSLQLLLPPEAFVEDSVKSLAPERSHGYLRNALREPVDADGTGYHLAVALGILRPRSEMERPLPTAHHLGRKLQPILLALVSVGVFLWDGQRYRWNDGYSWQVPKRARR